MTITNPLFKVTTHTLLQTIANPFYKENRTIRTSWEIRMRLYAGNKFNLLTVDNSFHEHDVRAGHYRYYIIPFNYVKCDKLFDLGYGGIHYNHAFQQKTTFKPTAFRRSNAWEEDMGNLQFQLYHNLSMPFENILADNPKYDELFNIYMDYWRSQ